MVVMSRHNICSPLTSGGAAYMRVTPYEWFKWTSPSSQLSQRGGVLETEMGQFFRKWVVSAGLLPDNYRPQDDEDKMDPVFKAQFTKMNDQYRQQILAEMKSLHGGPEAWMQSVQPTLTLMEDVIDMAHSPAAANDTVRFRFDDTQYKLEKGDEPKMTGGFKLAYSVSDALVLQCYESENMAAFGHELTEEQWRDICRVKEVHDGLLYATHSAAVNLAYPLVSRIREELANGSRKFTFLCGHDVNLTSISAALHLNLPETEHALEVRTPIGSKLVFEKWSDGSDDYVAINLVYPKYSQMHARTLLSLEEPPMVQAVTIEGMTANSDGLYRLADFDARMAEAMAEYDAIEDAPTAVSSPMRTTATSEGHSYTLNGIPANASTRGIVINNDKKVIF
ncbi:MAG: glucose-1-phosphatase [Prevotella sp.]|nr:glucose-1-phosphatase [Prevotella sp.]